VDRRAVALALGYTHPYSLLTRLDDGDWPRLPEFPGDKRKTPAMSKKPTKSGKEIRKPKADEKKKGGAAPSSVATAFAGKPPMKAGKKGR